MRTWKQWLAALLALAAVLALCTACDANVKTIRLRGNATKGYTWDYEQFGDDVVNEVGRRYIDGNIPGTEDAPGVYVFQFSGTDPGNAKLFFHYKAEDAEGDEYLSTIVYDVVVDENGKITSCRPVGANFEEIGYILESKAED